MQNSYQREYHEEPEEREMHLRDYLAVIRKRRTVVLIVLGLIFFSTVIATFTATPIYTAASQVLIERNRSNSGLEYQSYAYEPEFLDTQTEIIRSANVARKVVARLKLATQYRHYFLEDDKNGLSLIGTVRKAFSGMIAGIGSFFAGDDDRKTGSKDIFETVLPKSDEEIIAGIIQGGLSVKPLKNTKIVTITYADKNPAVAKLVADAVVQAYIDELLEIKLATSNYSLKWMNSKAAEERDKLEKSERDLQSYMRENDLVTVENKLTVLPQKLSEVGVQLSKAETEEKELQDLLEQINAVIDSPDRLETIQTFAASEVLKGIRERIYKANQNIQDLSKKFGRKHPMMVKANDELRILREERRFEIDRIVSSVKNSLALASSKKKSLDELLASTKLEVLNLNERFVQYSIMKREVDSNRLVYDTLQAGIKKEGVTEQSQSINVWVVKPAELPGAPTKPNKKRNILIGLILGLCSGVGLAFFIDYLDNTIRQPKELEERFGLTVLGAVDDMRGDGQDIESFIKLQPLSPTAESYRLIRTSLLLSSAEHPPKTLLVTSMEAQDGKSSTTVNLARTLAQGGNSVLVIDCDLRRPRMHSLLGMDNSVGLSRFLAGNCGPDIIFKIQDEAISLIPSGPVPPDPAELLGSKKMKDLIDQMNGQFDFVLLDSPPIQSVTDSLALSRFVSGTILVVRAGKTTFEVLEGGLKKLGDINSRVLGFVLNGIKQQDAGKHYYGYHSYYARDDD
ncbi:MAG: polysaccharide biosynthesis tyrosine autokinase [Desulfoprunum sp.]|uniref:GumC family protein n=1 Tax=Desulfoprunum sp. TaxID=2020866 RepID=UPI003C77C838